jgi:hypothetical protein
MKASLEGEVVKHPVAIGSKSEHDAVCLVTPSHEYVLRRAGGNPFQDDALDELVGKRVRCTGEIDGYTLFLNSCDEL